MKKIILPIAILFLLNTIVLAQKEVIKQDSSNVNKVFTPQATGDEIKFLDEDANELLKVIDEGDFGSLELKSGVPTTTTSKLYNSSGTLHFNGASLGGGSGVSVINDLGDAKYDGSSLYLGAGAGGSSDDGSNYNTSLGVNSLNSNTSGYRNLAFGTYALHSNTIGNSNVGLGSHANYFNQEGSRNTIIGFHAGGGPSLHNKSGNVFLGCQAGYYELGNNKLYIENSDTSAPLIGGDFSTDEVYLNGNVGIGTQSPDARLHLVGDHYPNSFMFLESDETKDAGFRLMEDGIPKWHIFNNGADQALNIRNSSYAPLIIINQVSGYIGINKLYPARLLHLKQLAANSGLRIEHQSTTDFWENGIGTTTKNYKFYYNNLFRADISSVDGAYTQSSDSRLKKNIESISSVLDKVVQLNPAEYNFKESSDNTPKSIGFIAQEVEQIFPDLVRDLDDGYKGVVYDGFAVLAIKAIQEQQEMITSQGELITKMQAEIDELKNIVSKQ